jgi:hypothetical protein
VGGLNARLHPTIAWIELAMRLRAAGYRVVVEPNSVAVVSSMDPRLAPAVAHGFATERLYWRATVTDCWQPSLWRHLGVLGGLAISVLVRPRNAMQLLGRLCGWALAPLLPRWTMPEPTVEAEQDDGSSTTSTLRRRAKRLAG